MKKSEQDKGMTDEETKAWLLKWCDNPDMGVFSWPTDACGYDQHIRFVRYRNENWSGHGSSGDFVEFVRAYANTL